MVLDRFAEFDAWMHTVLHERRGETPYEMLCEWRRTYDVPASVPYAVGVRVEEVPTTNGTAAFCLIANNDDDVLVFARTDYDTKLPVVTMYHPTLGERNYTQWRSRALWSARAPVNFMALPTDVWVHFARHLCELGAFHKLVRVAAAPLCRAWANMWRGPRFESMWNDISLAALPRDQTGLPELMRYLHTIELYMRSAKGQGPGLIASLYRKVAGSGIYKSEVVTGSDRWHTSWTIPRFYIEMIYNEHSSDVLVCANKIAILYTSDPLDVFDFMCSPLCIPLIQ